MQRQMIQSLPVEQLNILSDYKPIFLCLNAESGVISNIGGHYPDQNILSFEKLLETIYEEGTCKGAPFNCSQ